MSNLYAKEILDELKGTPFEQLAEEYSKTLASASNAHPSEICSLYPEIIIQRRAVIDAIKLMLACQSTGDRLGWRTAHETMTRAIGQVEKLALSAAKINQLNNTSESIQVARSVMQLAVDLVFEIFGAFNESCQAFEREMRNAIIIEDKSEAARIDRQRLQRGDIQKMDHLTLGLTAGVARQTRPSGN